MVRTWAGTAARTAVGTLLVLLTVFGVFVHHDLTGDPSRALPPGHAGMSRTTGTADAVHARAREALHRPGGTHGPQHGGHSCALNGETCAAAGVAHAYAPTVPGAALALPDAAPKLSGLVVAPATGPPPTPPDRTTVLRL